MIDLYGFDFWLTCGLALVILVPIDAPAPRKWALALVNLGFVGFLLGPSALTVAGAMAVVALTLKAVERSRAGGRIALAAILATIGLLALHKLPASASRLGLGHLLTITMAIGYSYVALRLVEVFRAVAERRHPAPDLASTINYLLPFHALAAGPIQAYDDFIAQPGVPPPLPAAEALGGAERIAGGLFKKYVLAATIERIFLTNFRATGPQLPLEIQLNFLWLYLDFSAYSDIAVGIGRLLGVATPENFNRPYLARNLIDFWERWHISLSEFIRRNLFTPIQLGLMRRTGGRHPLLIASFSFSVSFLLCGLWHEASLRFLVWGALQALGLITCNLYRAALLKKLGRKGLNRYMEDRPIRLAGILITYEYQAFSLYYAMRTDLY